MANCRLLTFCVTFAILLSSFVALAQQTNSGASVICPSTHWTTGERESLPGWVLQSHENGSYVAVSDPCLTSEYGEIQAVLRAMFMAVMTQCFELNILNETYETYNTVSSMDMLASRFTQFVRFSSGANNPVKYFKRGRSSENKFGEFFIEIVECDSSQSEFNSSDIKITGEYVSYGSESSVVKGKVRSELEITASYGGELHSTCFVMSGQRESRSLIREIDGLTITNSESGRFWYTNIYVGYREESDMLYTLKDGIWCGLYQSMIYNIVNNPTYSYVVKTLNQSEDDSSNKSLIRSLYKGESNSITLLGGFLDANSIAAKWSVSQ